MFRDIKIKVVSGILTSINSGFLYYVIESKGVTVSKELNILEGLLKVLVSSLLYSIVYILPLVVLFGIPLSLFIDYALQRTNQACYIICPPCHRLFYYRNHILGNQVWGR
ncbi:hypothetical protein GGQ95_000301 [Anoxybacillus rupiensis]|nr:hypothetical protein [Anoxybacillus rupiensis]